MLRNLPFVCDMYCKCFFLTLLSSFDKCFQNDKKNDHALVHFMHQDWKDLLECFFNSHLFSSLLLFLFIHLNH